MPLRPQLLAGGRVGVDGAHPGSCEPATSTPNRPPASRSTAPRRPSPWRRQRLLLCASGGEALALGPPRSGRKRGTPQPPALRLTGTTHSSVAGGVGCRRRWCRRGDGASFSDCQRRKTTHVMFPVANPPSHRDSFGGTRGSSCPNPNLLNIPIQKTKHGL